MAGYPVFSAPGPTVDVKLFGEAATQGAALGQAIPSPVTSAITGAQAGIKYGQDFTREQAQIADTQAVAKIHELEAEKQAATQTADIQSTQAKLTDETAVATQDANLQTQENQFYDLMRNSSPADQAKAVLSGKYNQVFQAKPGVFTQQLAQIYADPSNGLDENTRDRIGKVLRVNHAVDYRTRQAEAALPKFNSAKNALEQESFISEAVQKLGTTPEEAVRRIQLVPHNSILAEDGYAKPDIESNGGWLPNPKYSAELSKGTYDSIDRDTGRVLNSTGSIGTKSYDSQHQYNLAKGAIDGTYLTHDLEKIKTESAPATSGNVKVSTFSQPGGVQEQALHAPQGEEDVFKDGLAKSLKLPAGQLNPVSSAVTALNQQIKQYINEPQSRGSIDARLSLNNTVYEISRGITNDRFKASPSLQAQYTQSHVDEYNKNLQLQALAAGITSKAVRVGEPRQSGVGFYGDVVNAFGADTPEDLYYMKVGPVYEYAINSYIDNVINTQQQRISSGAKSQKASAAAISFVTGKAQNGPGR